MENSKDFEDDLEKIDEDLLMIEQKYSSQRYVEARDSFDDQLRILSEEFETMGLPVINLRQPTKALLQDITSNAYSLIQIHRRTLNDISDLNIKNRVKDAKRSDQDKLIFDLKSKLEKADLRNISLENKLCRTLDEVSSLQKVLTDHKEETTKLKRYQKSKENQLVHEINCMKNENQRLKELCGQDIDKFCSKDDKFLKIIKKYKHNEEVQKTMIKKLEENNKAIVNEVLNLKEELALSYLDQNNQD